MRIESIYVRKYGPSASHPLRDYCRARLPSLTRVSGSVLVPRATAPVARPLDVRNVPSNMRPCPLYSRPSDVYRPLRNVNRAPVIPARHRRAEQQSARQPAQYRRGRRKRHEGAATPSPRRRPRESRAGERSAPALVRPSRCIRFLGRERALAWSRRGSRADNEHGYFSNTR